MGPKPALLTRGVKSWIWLSSNQTEDNLFKPDKGVILLIWSLLATKMVNCVIPVRIEILLIGL